MNITDAIVSNTRIMEDTTWLFVFAVLTIVGRKYSEASFGLVRSGYFTFILVGASGFLWKGIGLYSRVFEAKQPEWLFSVGRESFEATTGLLFTTACTLLVIGLNQSYRQQNELLVAEITETMAVSEKVT